ncbi:MAG: ABC transporter ATP-binding protein [Lachnospiraceae bacterium]|nr:ABC transporter ATP-binding protein [Lachnospiraceae bacterium]
MTILEVKNLQKIYSSRLGANQVQALKNVTFSVEEGEYIAVMGESGSGKTTLLNLIAALDTPTSGQIMIDGKELASIKEREVARFRRANLGFVFQEFNLLDTLTAKDNILLPLVLSDTPISTMEERLDIIVKKLGISDIMHKYPYEISGGQKQRCAVARAIITEPKLILADEPTGALDSKSSDDLLRAFRDINAGGQTIIMVTHSTAAASRAGRVLFIKDGEVFNQLYRGNNNNEQMYQRISDTLTLLATGAAVG